MTRPYEYYRLRQDFLSAFQANGHHIDTALHQVAILRDEEYEHVKTVLRKFTAQLKEWEESK